MTANSSDLPKFVLLSQTTLSSAGPNQSTKLVHPIIQYHFADDDPHDIFPRHDGESVIILDYDPAKVAPSVESTSRNIAVTGIKITDAPPSITPIEGEQRRSDSMFVIETIRRQDEEDASSNTSNEPRQTLALIRERNEILKQVLDSPSLRRQEGGRCKNVTSN